MSIVCEKIARKRVLSNILFSFLNVVWGSFNCKILVDIYELADLPNFFFFYVAIQIKNIIIKTTTNDKRIVKINGSKKARTNKKKKQFCNSIEILSHALTFISHAEIY